MVHNVHNAHNVYQSRKLRMSHGVCIARMVHNAHTRCNVCTLHHAIRGSRAREGVSLDGTTVSPAYCLAINSFLGGLHEKRGPGHHWRSPLVVLSLNTEGVVPCSFERRQGFLVLVLIDETQKGLFGSLPSPFIRELPTASTACFFSCLLYTWFEYRQVLIRCFRSLLRGPSQVGFLCKLFLLHLFGLLLLDIRLDAGLEG